MSIKQAIEALEVAQDTLDISQSLQESAKSNHHPKTLAAYERVSAALAALRSMQGEAVPVASRAFLERTLSAMEGVIDVADRKTVEFDALRSCVVDLTLMLHSTQPPTEAVRMSEAWQPIETAPKDGRTMLLGYLNALGNWRTMRGRWMSADYIEENWEDPDNGEEGWFETAVEPDDVPNCWATDPTHWQPLPPPPVEQATAERLGVTLGDV